MEKQFLAYQKTCVTNNITALIKIVMKVSIIPNTRNIIRLSASA